MSSEPAPAVPKSKGMIPVENEPVVLLPEVLAGATDEIGPRMRTTLVSRGLALAAISGVTVTVFCARLTTLEAAKLKARLKRAALSRVMVRSLLGSSINVTVTWPSA